MNASPATASAPATATATARGKEAIDKFLAAQAAAHQNDQESVTESTKTQNADGFSFLDAVDYYTRDIDVQEVADTLDLFLAEVLFPDEADNPTAAPDIVTKESFARSVTSKFSTSVPSKHSGSGKTSVRGKGRMEIIKVSSMNLDHLMSFNKGITALGEMVGIGKVQIAPFSANDKQQFDALAERTPATAKSQPQETNSSGGNLLNYFFPEPKQECATWGVDGTEVLNFLGIEQCAYQQEPVEANGSFNGIMDFLLPIEEDDDEDEDDRLYQQIATGRGDAIDYLFAQPSDPQDSDPPEDLLDYMFGTIRKPRETSELVMFEGSREMRKVFHKCVTKMIQAKKLEVSVASIASRRHSSSSVAQSSRASMSGISSTWWSESSSVKNSVQVDPEEHSVSTIQI